MPISTVPVTGIFKQPEELRMLVASSPHFQSLVGAATQLEAMEHVHTWGAISEFGQVPPFATIHGHDLIRQNIGIGSWDTNGALGLDFEFVYECPDDAQAFEDAKVQFLVDIATIMSEIEGKEREDNPLTDETFLNLSQYSFVREPWPERMAEQELPNVDEGDPLQLSWSVGLQVEWI